jgi:hypothetical protein
MEPGDDCECEEGHEHIAAVSAGGESTAPHKRRQRERRPHILGRPGPGEPSGFLAVPGRAEGVRGRALRLVLLLLHCRPLLAG